MTIFFPAKKMISFFEKENKRHLREIVAAQNYNSTAHEYDIRPNPNLPSPNRASQARPGCAPQPKSAQSKPSQAVRPSL
jgi:hypothetical protein